VKLFSETRKGRRPGSLVFVHGNSSSSAVFDDIFASDLANTLIRFDLPGHGQSPRSEDPEAYQIGSSRKLLVDFCNSEVDEEFILVGNSLGGHLVMESLPHLSSCVAVVIFGAPPIAVPLNMEEAFLPNEALPIYLKGEFTEEEIDQAIPLAANGSRFERLFADFRATDPSCRDSLAASIGLGQAQDQRNIVASWPRPVYVLHGRQDISVNLDYIKGLEGITRIYEIEGCGHYPSLEQPTEFNSIMSEIVGEVFGS